MSGNPRIRRARDADAAAIAAVHLQSSREAYGWTAAHLALPRNTPERRTAFWAGVLSEGKNLVLVAHTEHEVVGFTCGGAMPASIRERPPVPGFEAYLFSLYLLGAWHRRGIGRALLGELVLCLTAQGFRSLALHVAEQNPARAFYERLGARFVRAEPYFDGVDEGTQLAYGWRDIAALLR